MPAARWTCIHAASRPARSRGPYSAKATVVLRRPGEAEAFELWVNGSFAPYAWLFLENAAREFGVAIASLAARPPTPYSALAWIGKQARGVASGMDVQEAFRRGVRGARLAPTATGWPRSRRPSPPAPTRRRCWRCRAWPA